MPPFVHSPDPLHSPSDLVISAGGGSLTTPSPEGNQECALPRREGLVTKLFELLHSLLDRLEDYFAPGYDPY
jgi:hypothetical protein